MSLKKLTALSMAGLVTLALAAPVLAQGETFTSLDAIVKRQEVMKEIGGTLRSAGGLSGDDRVAAAQKIVDDFALLGELFPEDSKTGAKTEALPAIWTDQDGFMAAYAAAMTASANVLAAAQSDDNAAWGASLKELGGTCGGCHTKYRAM